LGQLLLRASVKSHLLKVPTDVGLGKYVKVPDYNEKLGFIHHVIEDLQIVLDTIPPNYRRMVIFIDNLSLFSYQCCIVTESIHLFLAGNFNGSSKSFILLRYQKYIRIISPQYKYLAINLFCNYIAYFYSLKSP
jgi:hypothetical protein